MIVSARDRGVRFLVERQREDDSWSDFDALPIGAATEWVTAFVASALLDAGGAAGRDAADGAVAHLVCVHAGRSGGWGYNATTGSDADSTAWALLALAAHGTPAPPSAVRFVESLRRRDEGFATYPRADGWGLSHPDVTPTAALALSAVGVADALERAAGFALRTVARDGTWPSYWWRGRHYSTYWNRVLCAAAGHPVPPLGPAPDEPSRSVRSAFDMAWVLAIAALDGDPRPAVSSLARLLIDAQRDDGGWQGAPNLRVTSPACHSPWVFPVGQLYTDGRGLMTTASAIRALTMAVGENATRGGA